jgi:hypothetical protein
LRSPPPCRSTEIGIGKVYRRIVISLETNPLIITGEAGIVEAKQIAQIDGLARITK